ncbi:TlpA disulfide reductase family protein [Pedobacter sp.]|jgi:thiol-disulfide isomerase/thioredoxin|uniref:TlpA family protein disulfide reductase n=1 Tax=Pedobacter sp. TaxID=1411316 RepID=UPI002C29B298|nr:TlpA disulfide reductase family protein [Pedobacter sp.]HWW38291.1 TlpA disulfide reductase family protein [Pedobacter sp.]
MNLKKTTNIILLLLIILFSMSTYAQDQKIKALKIGDKVPDFLIENIKNSEFKTRRASDLYGGGLLIINFWETYCVPCVREMPVLNKLAAKFKGKYNMLCVSSQDDHTVDTFIKRNTHDQLMFTAIDTVLCKYFPHKVVPHNVWIDKNGVVVAITDDYEVNEKNIELVLKEKVDLSIKDEDLTFDWQKPLKTADSNFIYRSVITPFKNIGNGGTLALNPLSQTSRFMAWNALKTDLIWSAYMKTSRPSEYKLIDIFTKDSASFFFPAKEGQMREYGVEKYKKWERANSYCYELFFNRKVNPDQFYDIMAKELCLFFNVKVEMTKKPTECWVLTKLNKKILQSRTKGTEKQGYGFNDSKFIAKNQPLDEVVKILYSFFSKQPPFVNETGIKFNIDMEKDFKEALESGKGITIEVMRAYLNSIGLELKKKMHAYPHLTIYDLNQ